MIEVEVKLPVRSLSEIGRALTDMGFQKVSWIQETDRYYDSVSGQIRSAGEALRIRQIQDLDTGKEESVITFKGKKLDQVSMTRKELETDIKDAEVMDQILCALGFSIVPPVVSKQRKTLSKGLIHACLDEVKDLGTFLELEIVLSEVEDTRAAFQKIEDILEKLGYHVSDTTRTSYLTQLQNKIKGEKKEDE